MPALFRCVKPFDAASVRDVLSPLANDLRDFHVAHGFFGGFRLGLLEQLFRAEHECGIAVFRHVHHFFERAILDFALVAFQGGEGVDGWFMLLNDCFRHHCYRLSVRAPSLSTEFGTQ